MRKPFVLVLAGLLLAVAACDDDATKTAAAGATASASAAVEVPSASPEPSPSGEVSPAPAATETAAPDATKNVKPAGTTKAATKAATTKATTPAATTATVTSVTVTLAKSSFTGSCSDTPFQVYVTWSVHLSLNTEQKVNLIVHTSDGAALPGYWLARDGAISFEQIVGVAMDAGHPHKVVDFWVETTAPSRAQSARKAFTIDCH
ncbi:hypothetical protein ACQP00_12680 [Dactylosporangium sp. CS-047395]|uniref:hypothetical protein n=1 Tax=Dactylosporangium sp. CS-047395 TaxID=3239936 RepID=UPI003D8FEC22